MLSFIRRSRRSSPSPTRSSEKSGRRDSGLFHSPQRSSTSISLDYHFYCFPCDSHGDRKEAHAYCESCTEFLCDKCFKHHRKAKTLRKHKLLGKEKTYKGLMRSKSLTDCSGKCPTHPKENVTWYCRFHFQPGCHICKVEHPENCNSECVPDHNENANAEYVSNIIKEMDSFETKANDKITKAKKNLEDVESYYDSEVEKIRRMCKMLKDHLDSLENNALKEAKELFEEDKKTMETIIDNCEDAREEIQMVKKKTLKDSKKSSRNSSLRKSNPDIIKVKAVLSQNEKCNSVRHYHFEPDEGMFQYILGCNEIGIMHVADEGCVSVENADSDIPTDSTATTDDDIRPVGINGQEEEPESKFLGTIRVKSRSDRNPCYITGISVLSNEELVIADSQNNCIKMVDIERKKISSYLKMSFSPQDVTVVNNNLLAVTLPCAFLSMIQIVTRFGPFRWRTSHSLKANGNCYGITSTSDKLIVSFTAPPKVEVLSLQGEVLNTLDTSTDGHQLFNQPRHLTVSEDKQYVYVSDRGSGSLTRLALSGDKDDIIQISQDTGWHISPEGIVTAEDSVLVCDMGSEEGNVYAFQEDLSEKGIVYDSKDGIRYPKTICYSPYQNKVFITCHGEKVRNKIFLFKL